MPPLHQSITSRSWRIITLFAVAALLLCVAQCRQRHNHDKHDDEGEAEVKDVMEVQLTPAQLLGKKIFFDTNLSNPPGQSCATCHMPGNAFADPEGLPVSRGAVKTKFGHRNSPTIAYAAFSPHFHYDSVEEAYIGGLFWDGRANTLSEQALIPLMSHFEMNNTSEKTVVDYIKSAPYANLFKTVYGPKSFDDTHAAFLRIAEALEEYEETVEVSPFTSKFDYYMKGLVKLTPQEERGLKLFNDEKKGNCAACHPSTPDPITGAILFTDFTYDNLGVPANPKLIELDKDYKKDCGLGSVVKCLEDEGKFKVPTLRNIDRTAPYFHNGVYKTLEDVVRFYNSRDVDTLKFGPAEVKQNVNKDELGNLGLTEQEIKDIAAFMRTLSDGYNFKVEKD